MPPGMVSAPSLELGRRRPGTPGDFCKNACPAAHLGPGARLDLVPLNAGADDRNAPIRSPLTLEAITYVSHAPPVGEKEQCSQCIHLPSRRRAATFARRGAITYSPVSDLRQIG